MSKVKVGIIGATGYVGVELIRLLNSHPQVELTAIGSNSFVDKKYYRSLSKCRYNK